ncbi:hypothetical protein PHLCEN_2v8355 [Hermanssonia centrifuga]|uniref:Uncharacterized protein n=1 Tax=Hermanssonia centrifuga TaxID=98765 RepID=A0A2R6NTW4_9APHY|nr:hypothetical protein PHLCEN_2v8355 [Hermanssonia centrifuga]
MSLELLPVAQAQVILNQPMEIGLYTQLTHRSQVAVELRARRIYGCRHCEQSNISLDTEAPLSAPGTTHMSTMQTPAESSTKLKEKTRGSHPKAGQGKPLKLFGFDGFRSHAKEK